MRKSLLTLGAACIALSGMASARTPLYQAPGTPDQPLANVGNLKVSTTDNTAKRLPSKAASSDDIISSVDGTRQDVTITGTGYYLWWGIMLDYYENQNVASHVVYGENNEVYVYNMIPNYDYNYYVKGTKDGDKIVFNFPQTVYYDEDDTMDLYGVTLFDRFEYIENGELAESYKPVEGPVTVTFTVAEDGTISSEEINNDKLLGIGSCSNGYVWNGYGAISLSIKPFNDKVVAVPDDIEVSENFWIYDAKGYGKTVNWAQGYDKVYFQGLSQYLPEAWIMGTVEYGDDSAVIRIPQNQYLGTIGSNYIYTKCATIGEDEYGMPIYVLEPVDEDFILIWNYEDETLTAKNSEVSFLINSGKDDLYYLEEFMNLTMVHQDSFEGTPVNPGELTYYDGVLDGNWGYFNFQVPAMSTDGDYLLTDYLYYVIYIDGEPFEFDEDEYMLDENLVEVPWDFKAAYIYKWPAGNREVNFFMTGFDTIGVQSIYKYNGTETRSEIVSIDRIAVGVDAVDADRNVTDVKYYDLTGREVSEPASGIFVKRMTFDDGSVATFKKAIR